MASSAVAMLPLPVTSASAATTPPPMALGAQTHFAQGWALNVLDQAKAAGLPITFVRDEMFWKNVERVAGQHNSAEYDPYANKLKALGIKLLLELFNTNPLYDGNKFPVSAAAQDAFAAYAAYLVQRYGDNLIAVEVWNEPNGSFGYGVKPADLVAPYTSLCQKVYAAVKAVRTDIPVLVGSSVLVACQWHKRLIAAGILAHCDGVSFHPYQNPNTVDRKIKELKSIVGDKQLWCTEFGINRHSSETPTSHYRKMLAILAENKVKGTSVYLLRDWPPSFATMGLLDINGALTDQGNNLKEISGKLLPKSVTRGKTSPLLQDYYGSGRHVAWVKSGGAGTLGGQALTATPLLRVGTIVETSPLAKAELTRDWRGTITSHAYQGGAEVPMVEGGFPFDTVLQGPVWASANEGQFHPNDGGQTGNRWVATATGTYLLRAICNRKSASGDGVTIFVYARGVLVWQANVMPATILSFVGRIANLVVGQSIELRVGTLGTSSFDATGLEMAITANATVSGLAFDV